MLFPCLQTQFKGVNDLLIGFLIKLRLLPLLMVYEPPFGVTGHHGPGRVSRGLHRALPDQDATKDPATG